MTSNVSLADNFTVSFLKLLRLQGSGMETKQLNWPGNYRELRETGPWAGGAPRGSILTWCHM